MLKSRFNNTSNRQDAGFETGLLPIGSDCSGAVA